MNSKTTEPQPARGDTRWMAVWLAGLAVVGIWDVLFLNRPALALVVEGFLNTVQIALMVLVFTLIYGWVATICLHFFHVRRHRLALLATTFMLNIIRSIPQIVGVLVGYVIIAGLIGNEVLTSNAVIFPLMAAIMSLFIFLF